MIVCRVPAFTPQGYVLAQVIGEKPDSRGQRTIRVRALHGRPWWDAGMFGYSNSDTRAFYPEHVEIVKICSEDEWQNAIHRSAPIAVEADCELITH